MWIIGLQPLKAQEYRRRSPRLRIGKIVQVKGSVLGLGSAERAIQYFKRGDPLLNRQTILTRDGAQVTFNLGYRTEIILGPNSKVTLIYLNAKNRYLMRLQKGTLRHLYTGAGLPEAFVSGKSFGIYYGSQSYDAVLKEDRFYFKKRGPYKIYKFKRTGSAQKEISVSKKQIELLSQNTSDQRPVYRIKTEQKKQDKTGEKPVKKETSGTIAKSSAIDEAAAIFGESLSNTTAVDDAENIFGDIGADDQSNQSQAEDIFGDSVDTKSQQEITKLKDNIGVKLQQNAGPLPQIVDTKKELKDDELGPFDLSLFLKSTFYASTPRQGVGNVDSQSFHQDVRLSIGNKLNINDVESLTFSGWLEGSNRKGVYNELGDTLDLQSSKRNYIYLNELYYTYTTRQFDIQFGKKVIKQGKGIIYSPTDSFTATDVTVPTSPIFLGNFFLSVDYYIDNWTLTGIFLPAVVPNKSPTQNSRWTTLYSDINFQLEQEFPSGFGPRSKQIFLKLEGTKWGTDWLFSFFNGPNSNPVIRNDIVVNNGTPEFTLVQEHVPITFFSMGFSTTFAGFELHGELLNQNAAEGKDDSFTAIMLGFRYTMDSWPKKLGLNSIDTVIEHGRENLRSAQSRPFYALSSIGSRIYQNSWVGTFIFNVSDDFSFNYDFHLDLKNDGAAQVYGMNYNSGNSQWRLKIETYDGEDTSNFGLWRDNDNTTLEYVYNF